jgi:periplasmic copper chaperone A
MPQYETASKPCMTPPMRRRTFLLGILIPAAARAHSTKFGDIAIGHSWALPSRQTEAQVFFPIVNNGKTRDELIAARSAICSLIELRQNNRYDGPPLTAIVLEPGKPVPMRPTARHLRLVGLSKTLGEYESFKIVLDFLNAGEVEIEVIVEP